MQDPPPPRRQHYVFAHLFLRDRAHQMPLLTLEQLSKKSAAAYLGFHWNSVGLANKDPEDEFIEADGLACHRFEFDEDCAGVIVQFPRPERVPECWFAAIVVAGLKDNGENSTAYLRGYYTLEYGEDENGDPRTVLCQWQDQSHINYGDGPAATVEDFFDAVLDLIKEN